jgi:hypothetical protein
VKRAILSVFLGHHNNQKQHNQWEATKMPQAYPWHSKRAGETVYHNNTLCTEGNNIERYYLTSGTGNLKLCHKCATLNQQGK